MPRKTFTEVVKANPLVSAATGFVLIVSTISGTLTATGQLDAWVVTEAELVAVTAPLVTDLGQTKEAIDDLKIWNRCDRLERRLDQIDDLLFRLRRDEDPDEDSIREAERRRAQTQRDFDALECARVLAG